MQPRGTTAANLRFDVGILERATAEDRRLADDGADVGRL